MKDDIGHCRARISSRLICWYRGRTAPFRRWARAIEASGSRYGHRRGAAVYLTDKTKESLLDHLDRGKYFLLPNTAGGHRLMKQFAPRVSRERWGFRIG